MYYVVSQIRRHVPSQSLNPLLNLTIGFTDEIKLADIKEVTTSWAMVAASLLLHRGTSENELCMKVKLKVMRLLGFVRDVKQ